MSRKAVFILLGFAVAASGCRISANFYEIDPGKYYRSAQLTGPEFKKAITKLGIKTIINLRGADPGEEWYDTEVKVAEAYGVGLTSIKMSASRLPHRADLIQLLDLLRDAPRPILLHCKAGADRTGEASAIYQMEYMGKSKDDSYEMLIPKYFHFPIFTPAKRYFISKYQGLDWAYNVYDPCVQDYDHYDQKKYCNGALDNEPESPEEKTARLFAEDT